MQILEPQELIINLTFKRYNMEVSKVIHALYTDDDVLMSAVKKVKSEKYHIEEVYTPFPVHGLDKIMGLPHTRLAVCAFIYAM